MLCDLCINEFSIIPDKISHRKWHPTKPNLYWFLNTCIMHYALCIMHYAWMYFFHASCILLKCIALDFFCFQKWHPIRVIMQFFYMHVCMRIVLMHICMYACMQISFICIKGRSESYKAILKSRIICKIDFIMGSPYMVRNAH